jgi:iron complex outermembrane receptor protein
MKYPDINCTLCAFDLPLGKGFKAALMFTSAVTLSTPVYAQSSITDPPPAEALAPPSDGTRATAVEVLSQEIVVTAQKRGSQNSQDVPVALTAFGAAQLEALNVRDLKSLTYTMPNVQLDGIGTAKGTANFTIRGLGINTSVPSIDPTVGVFVNGIYLGVTSGVIMDDFDLEGIEVLRGPQGVLFGRNVTGGAVIIRTKRPTNEFEGTLRAGVESGPNWTVDGSVSGPLIDNVLSARVAAYYSKDMGWFEDDVTGESRGKSRLMIVRPSLLLQPSPDLEVLLRFEHGEGKGDGGIFQNTRLSRSGTFENIANEVGYYDSNWNNLTLEPDPKVVEQYQHLVIQPSLSRRWRKRWDGLVLLGASIAVMDCDIQAI